MKTRFTRRSGVPTIRINGKLYDQPLARIVFRCEVCFGELEYRNAGLACAKDHTHRGFIHRDEVKALQAQQAATTNELSKFYSIEGGKVVINANQGTDR